MSTRLIQLEGPGGRRVGMVSGGTLVMLAETESVWALATAAIETGAHLADIVASRVSRERLDYDAVYAGASAWRILPAADHPREASRCLVSGTGLTHLASAARRDAMHAAAASGQETDSMRMYRWGVEGGKPERDRIGTAPEWFYKGNGTVLRAHNEALLVPPFAEDGGEEPEIAGVYLIDGEGVPRRIGMTIGNEFSDHRHERRNYLYLAASKLRTCSIGPELVVDAAFEDVRGRVAIERAGEVVWSSGVETAEANMSHSLANLEHHHFKFPQHRQAGDVHIHFFGAGAFSFGSGIELADGDVMSIAFDGFGRALRNPVRIDRSVVSLVRNRRL